MEKIEPNTHAYSSIPIDGVWASRSLETGGFKLLPFDESVGDHSTMIFDASTRSLVGEHDYKVVCATYRTFNCKMFSLERYNGILKRLMDVHQIEEKLDTIIEDIVDDKPTTEQNATMEALDRQMMELQKHTERC